MSSDSELTELSEYEGPTSGPNKRRRKVTSEYRVTNALQQPNHSSYATTWLHTLMKEGDIKLDPEYQRDVVWSDSKQSKLIDSILRNYYIPPVIFSISSDKNGNQTRVCIDGKQRLTSIYRFLEGHIPHKDGGVSYYFQQADPSKHCRLLPDNLKRQFRNKTMICVEYRDLDGTAERDIFQRVQLGMALTTGETFQSYEGPIAKFVHKMHSQLFEEKQLDVIIRLSIDRGKGFQDLACTVACIARLPNYVHPTHLQQTKLLQKPSITEEETLRILRKSEKALNIIWDIARDERLRERAFHIATRTPRTSPVEFCFSTLLVAIRMDKPGVTTSQLAEQIGDMNSAMRALYADMRMNSKISLSFWNYINSRQADAAPAQTTASGSSGLKTKKIRVKGLVAPQTPSAARASLAHEAETQSAARQKRAAARSESATQFYKVFGSATRRQP
ncbi:unnamed protein product [Rhizoctonia solani]|uniref:GmrSD restriction endonucleases N-terminal domain-containing protein n=3 Tax=Rhizoctonia solani TaxID=456999 RepID=A0A8H3GNJ5_9AGAM|nr:DUF262 family protein [Rhizoctonia solani AG-3 Rhs1AP]KEP49658.1 DUF262 family protein [Rhizoctonia solani 123E]CAE6419801.1 unnamed protein product [Rhizoctonia solani]CAE6459529.1 unnamed protein product [Rhizoctonia solani]